jgi:hypothetical protein
MMAKGLVGRMRRVPDVADDLPEHFRVEDHILGRVVDRGRGHAVEAVLALPSGSSSTWCD